MIEVIAAVIVVVVLAVPMLVAFRFAVEQVRQIKEETLVPFDAFSNKFMSIWESKMRSTDSDVWRDFEEFEKLLKEMHEMVELSRGALDNLLEHLMNLIEGLKANSFLKPEEYKELILFVEKAEEGVEFFRGYNERSLAQLSMLTIM